MTTLMSGTSSSTGIPNLSVSFRGLPQPRPCLLAGSSFDRVQVEHAIDVPAAGMARFELRGARLDQFDCRAHSRRLPLNSDSHSSTGSITCCRPKVDFRDACLGGAKPAAEGRQ